MHYQPFSVTSEELESLRDSEPRYWSTKGQETSWGLGHTNLYTLSAFNSIADTPLEYPRSFVLGGKKKSSRWEGEGDKGWKGKKTGEKTEGEKRKKWKGKKKENHGERENWTAVAHWSRSRVQWGMTKLTQSQVQSCDKPRPLRFKGQTWTWKFFSQFLGLKST